jgi:hypothetical protein
MNPDSINHLRAFPGTRSSAVVPNHEGMSLRDYFAAKVLQGIYANPDRGGTCIDAAERAYEAADAMIRARSKE